MDMSIFIDTPVTDKAALKDFFLANAQSHSQIAGVMQQQGLGISAYPLTDFSDEKQWLSDHAAVHAVEFENIGLVGLPDLDDVNLSDQREYHDWQELHVAVHLAVNQAWGLV